ncbi:MAG TPA: type IV pilin protein [Xanthomonadales bacterium]|nr:type IV pilin protein [Xanthomonadales bacterium]
MQPKLFEVKGGAVPRIRRVKHGSGIQSLNGFKSKAPLRLVRGQYVRGFTLIEAMIVLIIIAILVALAYPAYIDQVRKARRADAQEGLLASAQVLERCFTRVNAYNDASCPGVNGDTDSGYYTVSSTITATTYTLTAAPNGDQVNDDCGSFSLDYLGNRSVTSTTTPRCWGSSSS